MNSMWICCYLLSTYLFVLVTSEENTAEQGNIIIDNVDNSMKVGQKVDESAVKTPVRKPFNITERRLILQQTPDGRPYGVYDGIIPSRHQVLVKRYLTWSHESWLFNNYDADDVNKQRAHDNTPWINDQDPLAFSKTKLSKRLIRAIEDVSKDDGPYYPYRVFGKIIRRGDHTRVSADSSDEGDYSTMIFVNEFWKKNYYGELYFYDKNREIIGGATHKPGRVAVWESTIFRLNRPPAVQFLQGQVLFQVQYSKNKAKMEHRHQKWLSFQEERKEAFKKWYLPDYKLPNGEPFTPPDPEKHKVFEYTTKTDGRKIFVYDDLFSEDLLNHLRSFVLKYGSYFYDDSIDIHSDNVQWIAGFLLKPYIQSPYWKIVQRVASHATGSSEMFPYDISINLVRSSDHTRIHGDVGYYGEKEFTCLVYLNPNWTKNYYGETTFFEKNSDDTEIVAQVRPRYGRTVIFDGNIPHSARPPSFNFSGARLTFVTKLHKNEFTGRRKNFQEELRHFRGINSGTSDLEHLTERTAKRQLDYLRRMHQQSTYHPDTEGRDPERNGGEEGDEKGNEDEEGGSEQEHNGGKASAEETQLPHHNHNEEGKIEFEEDDLEDEEIRELVEPLLDINEKSPDGVDKLKEVHARMVEKYAKLSDQFSKKLIEVM